MDVSIPSQNRLFCVQQEMAAAAARLSCVMRARVEKRLVKTEYVSVRKAQVSRREKVPNLPREHGPTGPRTLFPWLLLRMATYSKTPCECNVSLSQTRAPHLVYSTGKSFKLLTCSSVVLVLYRYFSSLEGLKQILQDWRVQTDITGL